MGDEGRLDLRSAEAVTRDVQYVVDTASNPVVAVLVFVAAIASEVVPLVRGQV